MRQPSGNTSKNPRGKIPGTKMIYAGLKDEQHINNFVAYLKPFDVIGKKSSVDTIIRSSWRPWVTVGLSKQYPFDTPAV
jgi:hypothetical protein